MKIARGITHSFLAGVNFALLLAIVDLVVRALHFNLSWVQIYQVFLVPLLVWPVIFSSLTMLALLLYSLLAKRVEEKSFQESIQLFCFSIPVGVAFWGLLQYIVLGDLSSFPAASFEISSLIYFLASGIAIVALLLLKKSGLLLIDNSSHVVRFAKHSRFVLIVFVGMLFLYDLFLTYGWTQQIVQTRKNADDMRPNIVFVTLDTLRADALGVYGSASGASPFLDSLANKSALFAHAYSSAPWTLPAHSGMFTGLFPHNHNAHFGHQFLDDTKKTLAEILRETGYRTAGFIAGPFLQARYNIGRGFNTYRDRLDFFEYRFNDDWVSTFRFLSFISRSIKESIFQADGERKSNEIFSDALSWLKRSGDAPFFLFLNVFDVHDPYDLGEQYRHLFTDSSEDHRRIDAIFNSLQNNPQTRYLRNSLPVQDIELAKALYLAELRWLDTQVEWFMDQMKESGWDNNTIFIFTSDHGDEFLEHGGVFHSDTLYNELIHVPLFIYGPQHFKPIKIESAVSTIDVFPVILELTANDALIPTTIDALSFSTLLTPMKEEFGDIEILYEARPVLAERFGRGELVESHLFSVIDYPWKLIYSFPERERLPNALYNLEKDPGEQLNLFSEEKERVSALEKVLEQSHLYMQYGKPKLLNEIHNNKDHLEY